MTIMSRWHVSSHQIILTATLSFLTFGCTVTETIHDFLSSTTPRDRYTDEGLVKKEYKPHVFVAHHMDNLKTDLARGRGKYSTSLTTLLHVSAKQQPHFFAQAQRHYPGMAQEQHHIRITQTPIALTRPLQETTDG